MVTYKYTAISKSGERVSGVVEGFNEPDAVEHIKQTCNVVLKLTPVEEKGEGILNMDIGGKKLNGKAFTIMCSQFAIILRAGVSISRAVHLIADKTEDKTLKKILTQVGEDVEAGRSLSASFAERGADILPVTFIETLIAGEESGNIDQSFQTMSEHFDKQVKTRAKVRGALAYPMFVLVLAIIVVIVLMVRVVPTFIGIFADYGAELPAMTKALIAISNFFQRYIVVIAAVAAAVILAVKLYGNTENGRLNLAKLRLKMPVIGNITLLSAASQFANTMAAMLAAGLPLTRAISITAKVIDNYYLSQEVGKLTPKLEQGYTLGAGMRESGVMPDILIDMAGVGEETGELEQTMNTIALYYDAELETATQAALSKLEPAVLVFMAVVAGFVVIAIYLAIFSMYGSM